MPERFFIHQCGDRGERIVFCAPLSDKKKWFGWCGLCGEGRFQEIPDVRRYRM